MSAYLDERLEAPRCRHGLRRRIPAALAALAIGGIASAGVASAACIDTSLPIAFEEQRLPNKLTAGNANPFAVDLLYGAGFTHFEADFINALGGSSTVNTAVTPNVVVTDTTAACSGGPQNYDQAFALMTQQGTLLWKTMVNRVQGRLPVSQSGDLTQVPRSDDRPLYWTRVTMTRALNRWNPNWTLTSAQRSALQLQLERTSRGQLDINFLPGPTYKRLIMSSFDVFTLPAPGTNGTGMKNGNPSAATALSLDGSRMKLPDGTTLLIETFVLPVSYPPFGLKDPSATNPTNFAMQEETLYPYFVPGPLRVDASISMSQGGGDQFNLEQWNARFHGPSAGNDGISLCPTTNNARVPQNDDCQVYPPAKFLGYNPVPWQRDWPPQFTVSTLPIAEMINAATGAGVPRPPGDTFPPANLPASYPDPTGAFGVQWHVNYTVFRNCDATTGTTNTATVNVNTNTFEFPPPTPPTAPLVNDCSRSGGGGDYLSNESAYRNTLLRDTFGLSIPAGHIHTPVMTRFSTGNNALITDSMFEQYRASIVQQARNLVFVVGRNLNVPPLVPVQAPDPDILDKMSKISSDRISNRILTLQNFGTRHRCSGNPSPGRGINAARDWILGEFNAIAPAGDLTSTNDPFTINTCPTHDSNNVITYIKGTTFPDKLLIVGGHYDSRSVDNNNITVDAPGANDSGSQTALVMELANIVGGRTTGGNPTGPRAALDSYPYSILFVTFSAEENGTQGSAALANTNLKKYFPNGEVIAMFNNDIVGGDNTANGPAELKKFRLYASGTPRETGNTDGRADDTSKHRGLMRYINWWGQKYIPEMAMVPELRQDRPGRNSDQTSFQMVGTPAVRFIETIECSPSTPDSTTTRPYPPPGYPSNCLSNNNAHQHSPFDLFEFVTPSYTANVARVELANLLSLARAPLAPRNFTVTGNGNGPLQLAWTAPESGAPFGYVVAARPITETFYRTRLRMPGSLTGATVNLSQLGLLPTETSFYISVSAISIGNHESLAAYSEYRCTPTSCVVPSDAFTP